MNYEIHDIKNLRKKYNLTQSDLAKRSGVSQSLIAKIESGKIDPAYSSVQKIFSFLESVNKDMGVKAGDIMTKRIISISPEEKINKAIEKMKRYEISQMPVIDDNKIYGILSESDIVNAFSDNKRVEKVREIMQDNPPSISIDSNIYMISAILKSCPLIIVKNKGKIVGIITKSDILKEFKKLF